MKAEQRREQVLSCAAALFAQKGFHQTSISDIVQQAAIARGTFYQYFDDKRTIFEELLAGFLEEIRGRIEPIDYTLGLDAALERLERNFTRVVEFCQDQRSLTRIMLTQAAGVDEVFDTTVHRFYQECIRLLSRSLEHGQQNGILRENDAYLVGVCVVGAVKELLYHIIKDGLEVDVPVVVRELFTVFTRGLLRDQ